jgi:hypothetical protein
VSGLALLLAGFALAMVVLWSIVNDKVPPHGQTTGWLGMRDDRPEEMHRSIPKNKT